MSQPLLRLAELVATLSIATDLGTGHPMERAARLSACAQDRRGARLR